MLPNNLTDHITKRTIILLIIVTVIIDIVLYFTKYSYFMDTIYDLLTFFSFYVGIDLHRRLKGNFSNQQDQIRNNRTAIYIKRFATVFLIFVFANFFVDMYSTSFLTSYWENFDEQVTTYHENLEQFEDAMPEAETSEEHVMNLFATLDMVGYDFLTSILAGSEEIWRLSYIVLLLLIFKKLFRKHWVPEKQKIFLGITVAITSILFGIGHTLAYDYNFRIWIGTVLIYSVLGLVLCLLLLWTRDLWLLVTVHAFYDVVATLSWHYIPWAVWYVTAILLMLKIISQIVLKISKEKATG